MYIPVAVVVISNILYNVCSKAMPEKLNVFASLTVTYLLSAVLAGVVFFVTEPGGNLLREYRNLAWPSWALALAVVGLEAGCIFIYKVGWNVSSGQLFYSSILAVMLLFIGWFFYKETVTMTKLFGVLICIVGMYFINK